ncbi:hypothetical protein H6G94_33260 [Nostoc punctiforme FACHB-252]|uniref:Transposase n=1 Tax=Nostoc punctiforme FACHB-252 TaxID=1357509 RepID=A0ABR8HLC8_NOSPU|nr:hypothetical protein [Nostoc punctiforme]MBD2616056.1 hypothetical protein [Nostoc punctiforme FACHB-252]
MTISSANWAIDKISLAVNRFNSLGYALQLKRSPCIWLLLAMVYPLI